MGNVRLYSALKKPTNRLFFLNGRCGLKKGGVDTFTATAPEQQQGEETTTKIEETREDCLLGCTHLGLGWMDGWMDG
jgi:hypothetical protein